MLNTLTARNSTLVIGAVALATIIGAWLFELAGYLPCELCLWQRWAYYAGAPLALALGLWNPSGLKSALWILSLLWLGSAVFGVYHSGVEWGWWQGPTSCSGGGGEFGFGDGLPDLSAPGVMCNEAAIRIFGLSLAGWNAIVSAGLAGLAVHAARK